MNGSTWVGRSDVKTLGVSSDARLRYFRQPSGTDCGTPASHGRGDGTDTLQNQRMRLARRWRRRRSYPRGHHHGEPDPGTGPEWLLEVIQPGYILMLTALDRMGRDTLCLFRWSGRGTAGVGHAGPCQGGGGDQSTDAGGGVGAAKGNTSGQCWIVPQAWIRTVRSKRNVPSLPVHGLTCKSCRYRFPVPPVGRTCFFAFGPNSDFLLRRLYASDAIFVARPAVSERLATYLFYFRRCGL